MKLKIFSVAIVAVLMVTSLSGRSTIAAHHRALFSIQPTRQTPAAQGADPITGEWDVIFHVGDTTTPATFTFKLEGTKVTGTAYSDHTGEGTIRDGKWLDGKLSFAADFKKHQSIVVQGILKDGKLAGECHHPEGPIYKWEARKKTLSPAKAGFDFISHYLPSTEVLGYFQWSAYADE